MENNYRRSPADEKTVIGIEFGSTRIKAVATDENGAVRASGAFGWESHMEGGFWSYGLDEVISGLQECFAGLKEDYLKRNGRPLTHADAMGVSAMMHGYLAFGRDGELLTPFRTWRNTTTLRASTELTQELGFNIPQRWSAAHFYQAVLDGEEHVGRVAFLTTLAGYVYWRLTGLRVLGVGDASGMFPIDPQTCNYDAGMLKKFEALTAAHGCAVKLSKVLPRVLMAGDDAGALTNKGALLLDPSGEFSAGAAVCPPEGDAGTGMAATGSVLERTGNVSAGTSIFAMTVLERPLKKVYPEIDVVATPDGKPVAMVHCNNCLGDFDAWVGVFAQFAKKTGFTGGMGELYELMFRSAGEGSADCGGVTVYNYLGGEPVTGLEAGAPMVLRDPDAHFTFDNLMRAQLYSAMAALAVGMRRLEEEDAVAQVMYGHGGLFKTKDVGQRMLASALGMPVAVRETAGEGGPWGMALLAAYMLTKGEGQTLSGWLGEKVFRGGGAAAMPPDEKAAAGFKKYLDRYEALLDAEKTAVAKRRAFEEK